MKIHELKIEKQYYDAVFTDCKLFEIRKNDRNYQVGDLVILNNIGEKEIGVTDKILCWITYITDYAQQDDYVVFGIEKLAEHYSHDENDNGWIKL